MQVSAWPPVIRQKSTPSAPTQALQTILTAPRALCGGTNAVYGFRKVHTRHSNTQLKTHSSLPITNFIRQTHTSHPRCILLKKISPWVIGIYTIATDTSSHSLLPLQAWIPTDRIVLLWTSPTTEPSRVISHHWRGTGGRKETQTQWQVILALPLL